MKKLFYLSFSIVMLSCAFDPTGVEDTIASERKFSVYCKADEAFIDELAIVKATHLNLFFFNPYVEGSLFLSHDSIRTDKDGSIDYDNKVRSFVFNMKLESPDVKILLAIGGWNVGEVAKKNYLEFCSAEKSDQFAQSILARVKELNLDGVDLDIEGDDVPLQIDNLVSSLKQKFLEENLLITAAVSQPLDRKYVSYSQNSLESFNYLNVMSYNYHSALTSYRPLLTASIDDFMWEIKYWENKDIALNKIVMGVPFNCEMWEMDGCLKVSTDTLFYYEFYEDYLNVENREYYYLSDIESFYQTENSVGNSIYIDCNNIAVMREKARISRKLGGVMCWQFAQDLFISGEIEKSLSWNIGDVLFK